MGDPARHWRAGLGVGYGGGVARRRGHAFARRHHRAAVAPLSGLLAEDFAAPPPGGLEVVLRGFGLQAVLATWYKQFPLRGDPVFPSLVGPEGAVLMEREP